MRAPFDLAVDRDLGPLRRGPTGLVDVGDAGT